LHIALFFSIIASLRGFFPKGDCSPSRLFVSWSISFREADFTGSLVVAIGVNGYSECKANSFMIQCGIDSLDWVIIDPSVL
jgi:hypothetical protein